MEPHEIFACVRFCPGFGSSLFGQSLMDDRWNMLPKYSDRYNIHRCAARTRINQWHARGAGDNKHLESHVAHIKLHRHDCAFRSCQRYSTSNTHVREHSDEEGSACKALVVRNHVKRQAESAAAKPQEAQ